MQMFPCSSSAPPVFYSNEEKPQQICSWLRASRDGAAAPKLTK